MHWDLGIPNPNQNKLTTGQQIQIHKYENASNSQQH